MKRLRDEALVYIYKRLREENERKPENEQTGLQSYLREAGILSPERQDSIRWREIPFSRLPADIGARIGESVGNQVERD